jgi:hemerythrin
MSIPEMPDTIEWKSSYVVSVKEIDSQHKKIFQLLNKLAVTVEAGKSHRDLAYILSDILNHFRYHFTSEEVYLEAHPDHDIHHQLHCDFTEKAHTYENQSKTDENYDFKEVHGLLTDWYMDHILNYDVKYFQYLLGRTVVESID